MKMLKSLNTQILLGAIIGILLGLWLGNLPQTSALKTNSIAGAAMLGGVFVDMLKMILVPLVFCSITVGIANLRRHQQIHRVWLTTLAFFIFSMLTAIVLALVASHIFQPGKGLHLHMFAEQIGGFNAKHASLSQFLQDFLRGLFVNPFKALAETNVLAIVVFALFLGVALVMGGNRYEHTILLFEQGLELIMRMVGWLMKLAPIGIAALLASLIAKQDASMLITLLKFVCVIVGTTLLHGAVVLPLILYTITRITPLAFWRGAKTALVTAFATASSNATLPVTLRCMQENFGVKQEIAGFVIPLGATVNMDGTALYEAAAALFIANLAGIELSLAQQLVVMFIAMIAAMGAPGMPSAGMVTMVMVLQSVGLPAEAIAILLPVDRLLDTIRTSVNVEGDMVGTLIVQKMSKDNSAC